MKELSLVEQASKEALNKLFQCINTQQHFRLEAGAGAGKTYSLIEVLKYLVKINQDIYLKQGKKIACITYTNVAKDEIIVRTDKNPIILCDTNHAFCWSLISQFQKDLRRLILQIEKLKELLEEKSESVDGKQIAYELGYRSINNEKILLHHDDVINLTIKLLELEKFRKIIIDKYPIILIDEYQDTDKNWIEAIKTYFLDSEKSPLFGFFGDHWQKIYNDGCGLIEHKNIVEIGKKANFRSNKIIVSALNKIRAELPQIPKDNSSDGSIHIFHTNEWSACRQETAHWKGDLSEHDSKIAFEKIQSYLIGQGWDLSSEKTKILMLTHKLLASKQGYVNIVNTFRHNESFIKKENKYIEFFIDRLEPACEAYLNKKYGLMFSLLDQKVPLLHNHADKIEWKDAMTELIKIRETGTVKDVINLLKETLKPRLPPSILNQEEKLLNALNIKEELSGSLKELNNLHKISYSEVIALKEFLNGHTPFQTKHGVKGAEFENVLVVITRGWNHYNFGEMLAWFENEVPDGKEDTFKRNKNLFYVACSRPKKRLAILFTQKLEDSALNTLSKWFGESHIISLPQA